MMTVCPGMNLYNIGGCDCCASQRRELGYLYCIGPLVVCTAMITVEDYECLKRVGPHIEAFQLIHH